MAPNLLMPAVVAPLAAFAVWRRLRSHFGPQPVRRGRLVTRVVLFAAIAGLASLGGLADLRLLEGLATGLAGGAVLGLVGLRLTRFERGADGADVYLPNAWVGGLVTLLLVGRLAWRFLVIMPGAAAEAGTGAPLVARSPLTMAIVGLTFGYYICYYAGLLLHHRRFERAQRTTGG